MEATFELLLKLAHIRVLRIEQTKTDAYIITVESTLQHATCHTCKRRIDTFYRLDDWIMLQHLPICGSKVFIRLQPKRFRCPYCSGNPTTTQELSWYRPRRQFTNAYEEYLLIQCINSTIKDVSIKEQVHYDAIEGVIDHYVHTKVDWTAYKTLNILGIDEIALRKGHRSYIVIITARKHDGTVHLLAVLPDRTKVTVLTFFRSIPYRLRRTVTDVCSDLYEAYLTAIEEVFGADISVIDRFHVARQYYEAVDDLRKVEMARLKRERKKSEYDLLKGVMWSFRRRPTDITPEEQDVLACLFSAAPDLRQAYAFRESLTKIFETPYTKTEAITHLQQWITTVKESGLTCLDGFLKLLTQHMNGIANYFRNRYTSGFVEGLNNRIKVLKRRCYGIFNLKHIFQRLTLDLSGYAAFDMHTPTTK